MFKIVVVGTILSAALAGTIAPQHPIRQEIVEQIRAKASTWVAHDVETNPLAGKSYGELMGLLGSKVGGFQPEEFDLAPPANVAAPTNFDPRQDPSKSKCIHAIRDQAKCGSCWAFGATEALSDRFCLKHGVDVILSPQDLVSCEGFPQQGCNGGYLTFAWDYLKSSGVVTDDCTPYESQTGTAPKCSSTCKDGSAKKKYKCADKVHPTTATAIEAELYANGPLEGGFTVYEDFMSYKSGIYQHTSGAQLGGHAIKIIGYGEESGVKYWLCANSWNTTWGEDGFFRIKQGEVGINDQVFGCTPATAPASFFEAFLQ